MNDRLRAKSPKTNTDDWREGTVTDVARGEGVSISIDPADGQEHELKVEVTDAVYDLFSGRVEDDIVGSTVYFIKKN